MVITNTNMIADMWEHLSPVRPDKCPPVIPDSDKTLREICYNKAHEIYGEDLPEVVTERLERELKSIIGNGFAVMYIIAQKLVWKSNDDGYLVGSRGSVGSSFVATMAGITGSKSAAALIISARRVITVTLIRKMCGNLPAWRAAICRIRTVPKCGHKLNKEGFDIPFETFLGFKGNKEPDIDLNFSGDYQSKAHKYTEVIFGAGQTFRAGTIGTLADKTAFGYVKNTMKNGEPANGTARSTGSLWGVPECAGPPDSIRAVSSFFRWETIYSFTPVQHPANDMTTDIVTTHFDYHSIDHNLLKLDILGHDDPTMIRMLEDPDRCGCHHDSAG